MRIRKTPVQEILFNDDGEPYVYWGKTKITLDNFYRELARFVDWNLTYWHGMDCTRDLVIHINKSCDGAILGKITCN